MSKYIYFNFSSVLDMSLPNGVIYVIFMCQSLTFRTGLLFKRISWQYTKVYYYIKSTLKGDIRMI